MVDKINTDGAAFPVTYEGGNNNGDSPFFHQGVTLRDYFAAKALTYLVELHTITHDPKLESASKRVIAQHAYEFADAMLAARGGAL